MGQPVDHDHEPVVSMDPVEPFEPDDGVIGTGWLI